MKNTIASDKLTLKKNYEAAAEPTKLVPMPVQPIKKYYVVLQIELKRTL